MLDILTKGGWIMLPLALCSIVAVAISIERFLIFKSVKTSKRIADNVIVLINKGQNKEAITIFESEKSPLLRVLATGIANRHHCAKGMEGAAIAEIAFMKRGLPILDTIITLSPLLGLLGTIIGMISSFQVMSVAGMGQPHAVTGGIAEALIATATGIIVAVVTLIPYNYFLARIEGETATMEYYGTCLEMALDTLSNRSEKHEDTKRLA